MHVFLNFIILGSGLCPFPDPTPSFSKLNFISKILNFTMQINAYQEGTKINTEVNERPLRNIGTHWNIRHRRFQRVGLPISFILANFIWFEIRPSGRLTDANVCWPNLVKAQFYSLLVLRYSSIFQLALNDKFAASRANHKTVLVHFPDNIMLSEKLLLVMILNNTQFLQHTYSLFKITAFL